MAYIGRQLVRGQNRVLDDISGSFNGSTTAFNLTVDSSASSPGTVYQLWIILGGVVQKPGSDFTVAGSQVTFTTAPAATLSFWGMIQGDQVDSNTPADASVTPSKIATSGNFTFPAIVTASLELVAASDAATTLTAAQSVNSLVIMTPTAARNVTTTTAANIVSQLGSGVKVGTTFTITLRNQASATHAMTLVGGTGVTLDSDNTNTVAATKTRQFIGRVTNKTGSSEAVTVYSMGEGVH
jgi:hypothetical protein